VGVRRRLEAGGDVRSEGALAMHEELAERGDVRVCVGRKGLSLFHFLPPAVLVAGGEGVDGEIRSEQSATCSAATAAAMGTLAAEAAARSFARGGRKTSLMDLW
jgi:hypothetical protein